MKWINVKHKKPKLGQQCLCYYVMKCFDGSILKECRVLYYLKSQKDNRKRIFSDKDPHWHDLNIGSVNWPVTYWMNLPKCPIE